jgi:hypothetical protein
VSRVSAAVVVPGTAAEARALWFDPARWPAFVDGFARVVRADPDWPRAGRLIWQSTPRGRGRVVETAAGEDAVAVEDERLSGVQRVRFEPAGEGETRVTVELEYRLKQAHLFTPLVDALFVRRSLADALARTLRRYVAEREGDALA